MKPISTKDVAESLDFVKDKKKSANYFKSEYREISKEDFLKIYTRSNLIKSFPSYLEEVTMTYKEFMLSTIRAVYNMIKHYESRKQIEIKSFLDILKKFLDQYNVNKNMLEIQDFYSHHAIELGFNHLPSRDPDKFVPLYLETGDTKNFAYISLE